MNPQCDINECKIYSSNSLYNFYNTIKTEIDLLELNNYKNLQPLCSKVNRDIKRNIIL
jgi:hypothetical protein